MNSLGKEREKFDRQGNRHIIIASIQAAVKEKWKNEWEKSEKGGRTRSFFPRPACFKRVEPRRRTFELTQVLTGHSFLNEFQHKLGFRGDPSCVCGSRRELSNVCIIKISSPNAS